MNVNEIRQQLAAKYPNKAIFENKIDGVTTEILCEVEPSSDHSEYSFAIAVIDKSIPHYHKELVEKYKVIKGKLQLFVGNQIVDLAEGDEYTIVPNQVHWAVGEETWVEVGSKPGWKFEDHILTKSEQGKLFLTSSTVTENLVSDFESLIGRSIKGLKVAFIPDAAYGTPPESDKSWVAEERKELVDWYSWQITDFILKDCTIEDLQALFDMDVIYVNGGFSGYLAKVMRSSGFDRLLPELLDKGIVYVGSSAGSMVMSDIQDASSWYINEPEPEAIGIPGLGYIDFQVYPHVKDSTIQAIRENCKTDFTYYLLRDGTAISINGKSVKLCGEGIEIVNKRNT